MENTLPLVKNRDEIQQNAATLDRYLEKRNTCEYEYAKKLIGNGRCFVVVSANGKHKFYPSRFMGYVGNSMEAHEKTNWKNHEGRQKNKSENIRLVGRSSQR